MMILLDTGIGSWGITEWLLFVGASIVLFLAIREMNLWYFKIDRHIELQEEQIALLKQLVEQTKKEITTAKIEIAAFKGELTDMNEPGAVEELLKRLG